MGCDFTAAFGEVRSACLPGAMTASALVAWASLVFAFAGLGDTDFFVSMFYEDCAKSGSPCSPARPADYCFPSSPRESTFMASSPTS